MVAAATLAGGAAAKPKPDKPPKPRVSLQTRSELGVLRRDEIRVRVRAKRARRVEVRVRLVVDGYPEDYPFKLGPRRRGIRDGDTTVGFKLSARQHEVLDFAAKTCRGATLAITARTEKRTGRASASLSLPNDC